MASNSCPYQEFQWIINLIFSTSSLGKSIFFMNKIDIYSRDINSLILSTFMYVIILVEDDGVGM